MDPVDAHASREVAQELMILRLRTRDADAEGGIREGFHDDADEFYDIFRHAVQSWGTYKNGSLSYKEEPGYPTEASDPVSSPITGFFVGIG